MVKLIKRIKKYFGGGSDSWRFALMGGAVMSFVLGVTVGVLALIEWGAEHRVIVKFPLKITTQRVITIVEREPKTVLSPVAQEVVEEVPEDLSELELLVRSMWGVEEFKVARAVAVCESKMDPLAVNWKTQDIGLFQINYPTWKDMIAEEFNYTIADLFDPYKNAAVAYYIWDRADGKPADGRGNWTPWMVLGNRCFLEEL